ncbi:aldo/keto reductase [Mucilaginibacter achroorhodeus]|uniref:Aldo/keto reductase n=1 Tax=Mucilaginibacter achroorhodeus TaxID=2599294 RepID=A0A563U5J1_9SPHI|nr:MULTISPECIES: aldo/keto reductase [Mucilaginibacter]QXV64601.1 aldo/keto reductase [Mucilaginibacter sp. 21P]TWR26585.1 aldo/keto reductase [Mucilaginibacter achroorhodeus]
MEKRELGKSGIEVLPLCFGGNVFGWTADEKTSFELLDAFVDKGFNFVDTADVYSRWAHDGVGGQSETIIGNWFKQGGKRDKIILATKVGKPMGDDKKGLSKAYITQAVEDSLRRLQTDYVDLYQAHDDDQETPLEETLEAFTDLIKQGKVRAIGASNYGHQRLRQALQVSQDNGFARYETLQPEYNFYDREDYERQYEALCHEAGLGVITYYSLASGFLTGKYRSENDLNKSKRGGGIKKYLNSRGFTILRALDEVAQEYNTTPASVAIAWLIARQGITAPIASATSVKQLDDLANAAQLELSRETIEQLTKASSY